MPFTTPQLEEFTYLIYEKPLAHLTKKERIRLEKVVEARVDAIRKGSEIRVEQRNDRRLCEFLEGFQPFHYVGVGGKEFHHSVKRSYFFPENFFNKLLISCVRSYLPYGCGI